MYCKFKGRYRQSIVNERSKGRSGYETHYFRLGKWRATSTISIVGYLLIWYIHFFDISNGLWDILKKTVFEKSLSGARCRKNVLTWVKTRLKCLPELESSVSPGRNSRGNISLKSGVGVFFYVYLDPCISKTVRYIKMCPGSKFLKFKDLQIRLHTFFRYLKRFLRYFEKTVTVQLSAN